MSERGMVIVGSGETGARAAEALREQGWTGEITLIGEEREAPYERPPLSKAALLSAEEPLPSTIIQPHKLSELDIRWLAGNPAVRIDRSGHEVALGDGSRIKYERLLLATGAKPRELKMEGFDRSGALYLRTFADALAIRSRLVPGRHIVVIGGGFIGLETAASARERGCEVTLLEVGPRVLMRGVPQKIAAAVEERHRIAGVNFRLGVGIGKIERAGAQRVITLEDGSTLLADAIIVGIGAIPRTEIAADCGLTIDNGVAADESLRTSDPDIFAAGDCCSFPHRLYGGRRIRLEAWRNAYDQGIHVAKNMVGSSEPYEAVPWFWSDQYDLTLQVAGLADGAERMVRRKTEGGDSLYFHLAADGSLAAVSGIGSASLSKEIRVAEMLIGRQTKPDPALLADPDVKLKAYLTR